MNDLSEFINSDISFDHSGIVYLPLNLLTQINDQDELTRIQIKSKIIYILAKQLSRYWYNHYHFTDCTCSIWNKNSYQNLNNINPFITLSNIVNADNENNFNPNVECIDGECNIKKSSRSYDINDEKYILDYNIDCFLRKGIIAWLSYTSLQSIQSELYDLVIYKRFLYR